MAKKGDRIVTKIRRLRHLAVDDFVRLEQMDTLAGQAPATFAVSVINALIVYYLLRDMIDGWSLLSWASAVIAFNCLRMLMVLAYARMTDEDSHRTWLVLYLVLIYLTGLSWGILPLVSPFTEDALVQGFLIFVIVGMAAGGLLSLYVKLSAAIPYYIAVLTPLIWSLASDGMPGHIAMALLASFFLLMLVRTTYVFNRAVNKTIRLELENRDLFNFLVEAQAEKDASRHQNR